MTNREMIEQMIINEMRALSDDAFAEEYMNTVDELQCISCKAKHGGHCPHPEELDLSLCHTNEWLNEEAPA